jgi:hypothetical protein
MFLKFLFKVSDTISDKLNSRRQKSQEREKTKRWILCLSSYFSHKPLACFRHLTKIQSKCTARKPEYSRGSFEELCPESGTKRTQG